MPYHEEGIHNCKIIGQGFTKSATKGTPGFYLKIQPDGSEYEREVTWWITEGTHEFAIRDLRKLGFQGDSFGSLDPDAPGYHDFAGQSIHVECRHEPGNNGKTYERWELPFAGTPRETASLEKKEIRKLDNLFGKALKQSVIAAPAEAPAEETPAAPQEQEHITRQDAIDEANQAANDDDIPF